MGQKLSWRRCCRGAGRPLCVAGQLGHGGEQISLPRILSCLHMERYSRGGLDSTGYKVGSTGRPARPTWQGLRPTGSTWSEVDRGDLGLTFC
jgi:hypothetical protein